MVSTALLAQLQASSYERILVAVVISQSIFLTTENEFQETKNVWKNFELLHYISDPFGQKLFARYSEEALYKIIYTACDLI